MFIVQFIYFYTDFFTIEVGYLHYDLIATLVYQDEGGLRGHCSHGV